MNSVIVTKKAVISYFLLCQANFVPAMPAPTPDLPLAPQQREEGQKKEEDNTDKSLSYCRPLQKQSNKGTEFPFKYAGNLYSHKFHRPSCPFAKAMSKCNKVRIHFRHQAIEEGFTPCRYCLPPVWTSVQAKIKIPPQNRSVALVNSDNSLSVQSEAPPAPLDISRP